MNHEAALPLIGDLLHGRLSGRTRDDVLSHVRACDECKSLSDTYALLSEAWNDDEGEHPSSQLLVQYAIGEDALDEEERDRIASHVVACEPCAAQLEATSQAEAELTQQTIPAEERPTAAAEGGGRLFAAAVAAAVVLGVLAYPAYLGLFEVPRINDRLAVLEAQSVNRESAPWAGPVSLHVLSSPVRDAGEELPVVEVPEGQPQVLLAVDPGLLEVYDGAGAVHFDIRDTEGQSIWSWELSEVELRDAVQGPGVVTMLVPAEDLPSEALTLSVSLVSDRDAPLFEAPFRVTR